MNSYIEGQLADQRRLKDQQFQDKHDEIQGMIGNLSTKLASTPEDARNTPDYLKLKDQLAQTLQSRDDHWKQHANNPSELQKFAKMIGKDLKFGKGKDSTPVAPPVYSQPTMDVNGEKVPTGAAYKVQGPQTPAQMKAAAEAAQLVAAGPVSPEQAATQQGRAESAKSLAEFQGNMKLYDQNHPEGVGPNATPEGKQARQDHINELINSTSGVKEPKEPIETWTDVKGAVAEEYPKGSGQYRILQQNKKGERHWGDALAPDAPKQGKMTGPQLVQDSYLATLKLPFGTPWSSLTEAQRSGYQMYLNRLKQRSANRQTAITDRDGNVHIVDLSSSSGPVEVSSPQGKAAAPGAPSGAAPDNKTPKSHASGGAKKATKEDIVLNFKKATPDYTKAKNLYNDANRIAIQGDGWLQHHSSEADQNFVLSLIKSEAGRVNQQEIAMMFDAGGITEGPERWAAKIGHGELPQELRKQIVDFTHTSRDAAKQVLDEMNTGNGSTSNAGGTTPDAAAKSLADRLHEAYGKKTP